MTPYRVLQIQFAARRWEAMNVLYKVCFINPSFVIFILRKFYNMSEMYEHRLPKCTSDQPS